MLRCFVTGTDTGVGKTQVASALLSLLADRGDRPFAFKPCESGGTGDARSLQRAGGGWQALEAITPYFLREPLAPAHAARRQGLRIDFARLLRGFRALGTGAGVVEGAGGLHVPLTSRHDVIDLIQALSLPVILVARAGLGTVNHTTLSLRALQARKLEVAAVVLSRGRGGRDPSVALNRAELERRFPRLSFVGPVPFLVDPARRHAAFRRALAPLL